ncbi:hypothetical protein [Aureimonas sp. Leaf324]|uniref:hypothetical protein n=1 Tax=Aureimonas sp. Leaf324 TaxID=1736336 RepID=UPI0006F42997|nr:hypothetical protein [Aureimonas sp. Leaf324]KQQ81940.1 hypothetical protein ASF65_07750 [Aureimonas sp. Leaf324]
MSLTSHLTITLGDDEFELVPSLKAATAVSNRFSGFQNAMNAVQAADLASVQFVIRQGVPLKQLSTEALNEAIYRKGTFKTAGTAIKFLTRLANGGREMGDEEGDDETSAAEGDEGNGEV